MIINFLFIYSILFFLSSSLLISYKDILLRSKRNLFSMNYLFSICSRIKFYFILPLFLIIAKPKIIEGTPAVNIPR